MPQDCRGGRLVLSHAATPRFAQSTSSRVHVSLILPNDYRSGSFPLSVCRYLQGNQFTGELPQQLFRLVFFFRLSVLNVGNNKLSGPVPLEYEGPRSEFFFNLTGVGSLKIVSYTLSEIFSDLWLLGNDWDGGPCAGFCVNTGPLDEAKRELSGVWAKKCFDDTSSHEILLDNKYSINELGQCLPKSPTCGQGYSYVTDRKIVSPDCRRCPIETYQSKSGHKENMCNDQPKCNPGEKISGDDADLRNMRKTCVPCEPNTYQDESDHRRTFCHEQTTCSLGQEISDYSATARQRCSPCPRGGFQNEVDHREMSCKPQPKCDAGQSFLTTSTDERQCTDCGESTYQSTQDEDALQAFCIEQPFCGLGQKMSAYSKTRRRTCSDCPFGMYQDQNEHRSENCKVQPPCKNPGTYYKATLYDERVCTQCPDRQYQEMSNHTTAECLLQRRCSLGFGFVGDQTTFGECIECNRTNGEYQDEDGHREPCKYQPICTQSREVVVVGTTTQKQVCVTKTATCSGVGKLLDDGITCNCNGPETGIGPTCSEHSNGKTCNGRGIATYNAITKLASCSNCTDPAIAVGDRCQFSNPTTCNSFGIVSINGTCTWNRNSQDEPIVSKCDAGYYYNPTPATITETSVNKAEEDAIEGSIDDCYPCSPGQFANGTARRVKCDECPVAKIRNDDGTFLDMLQTSEPASTSASDCFAKFQSAAADQQFCYGENIDAKPLSRIKSSDDCSISATSLGLTFAGEFVLPYPGCVYDEEHQEARFYVGQSQYDQALSTVSSNSGNNDDDGSNRRRRKERQQHQQRRRKQQQPWEQDQQPQRRSHQKRRRKMKLVPMKDTPLCELYVCKDPKNEVTALTSDPADAGASPSCRVSVAQIKEAYAAEQAESQSIFMPAAFLLSAAALVGSYVHQYRSASKAGLAFTIWHHLGAWLTALRVFDMLTDFGFYFISLHGSEAFLEAYGDGDPDTTPYEEPKVAAFLYISVFCTALGLFMTPLDIWAMSQRSVGGGMGIIGVAVVLSITLFEDTPQLALASIYINTMREVDIEPDPVSILSLAASALSMLFNVATVVYYTRKLRVQDPTGWWKGSANTAAAGNTPDQTARIDALEAENTALKQDVAQLKSKKRNENESKTGTVRSYTGVQPSVQR